MLHTLYIDVSCYEVSIKKEDVVWLPMRQLSTRDQNDTDINNYRSPYGLQKWAKPIPRSQL